MHESTRADSYSDRVAAEIRAHLGRYNITGRELARRLDEQQNWVSRRLSGTVTITVNDLLRIARVLDVQPSALCPDVR